MHQYIILFKDRNLDATAKFLLLRFVQMHGCDEFTGGIKELAAAVGLSDGAVSKSLPTLLAANCIARRPLPDRKGRPTFEYRVKQAYCLLAMERSAEGGSYFDLLIEMLLGSLVGRPGTRGQPGKPPARAIMKTRLSPGNIVLLCVYLSMADKDGVVRRAGASDLAAMAGLSKPQLKTHNRKLLRLGYLRTVVSGVSGQTLFGASPGATYLNLQHPEFAQRIEPTLALVYPLATTQEIGYDRRQSGEAAQLFHQVRLGRDFAGFLRLVHGYLDTGDQAIWRGVTDLLRGKGSVGLTRYLQSQIETYTSRVLSTFWGRLGEEDPASRLEVVRWLQPQVTADLLVGNEKHEPREIGRALVAVVSGISLDLAERLRSIVSRTQVPPSVAEIGGWEKLAYVILPHIDTSLGFDYVILGRPKEDGYRLAKSQILRFDRVNGNQFAPSKHGVDVHDFENDDLVKIGLLSRG